MIKPKRLNINSTIGIIAPASPVFDSYSIEKGVEILKSLGYKVVLGESCYLKYGYLAGNDEARAKDVNKFFERRDIDAVICIRGGYGSMRILDLIDYGIISKHPKIFVGYSDITAVHFAINRYCKLVTFHGPMAASDISDNDELSIKSLINCLAGKIKNESYKLDAINEGNISGRIIGGNLSLVCSLMGTKYEVNFKDKILFIEDIGEEPYRIDRMLQQLKLSGVLNKLKGVVLGQFTDCEAKEPDKSLSIDEVIKSFFAGINIPVYYNFPVGHDKSKITVPIGTKIKIQNNTLCFMEEGVI